MAIVNHNSSSKKLNSTSLNASGKRDQCSKTYEMKKVGRKKNRTGRESQPQISWNHSSPVNSSSLIRNSLSNSKKKKWQRMTLILLFICILVGGIIPTVRSREEIDEDDGEDDMDNVRPLKKDLKCYTCTDASNKLCSAGGGLSQTCNFTTGVKAGVCVLVTFCFSVPHGDPQCYLWRDCNSLALQDCLKIAGLQIEYENKRNDTCTDVTLPMSNARGSAAAICIKFLRAYAETDFKKLDRAAESRDLNLKKAEIYDTDDHDVYMDKAEREEETRGFNTTLGTTTFKPFLNRKKRLLDYDSDHTDLEAQNDTNTLKDEHDRGATYTSMWINICGCDGNLCNRGAHLYNWKLLSIITYFVTQL